MSVSARQHAVGFVLSGTVPANVSLANASVVGILRKPDRSVSFCTVVRVGESRVYTYATQQNDLNLLGTYTFALRVSYTSSTVINYVQPTQVFVWAQGASVPPQFL